MDLLVLTDNTHPDDTMDADNKTRKQTEENTSKDNARTEKSIVQKMTSKKRKDNETDNKGWKTLDSTTIIPQEGYRLAQELRCDRYMECSAQTGELMREVFQDIAMTAVATVSAGSGGPRRFGMEAAGGGRGLSEGGCILQ